MSEAQWLAGRDPTTLLHALPVALDQRKVRLFACACCRRIWHLLPDPAYREAVAVNELYADGEADEAEWHHRGQKTAEARLPVREDLLRAASAVGRLFSRWWGWNCRRFAEEIATEVREALGEEAEREAFARGVPRWETRIVGVEAMRREEAAQAALLRDIFGNPFRPSVVRGPFSLRLQLLAEAVYGGAADAVGPLHDALLDIGLTELAEHFRQPDHPRGCWWIDRLRGKG
jgi:hypothetical protein